MTKNLFTKVELQRLRELPIERVASRLGLNVRNIVASVRFTTTTHRA